jgi:ATP-binding cassette, subfamily C (CFTR/MRP), member 1
LLFLCQTAFLAVRAVTPNLRTAASLTADILGLVSTLGACLLSWLDHYRSIRPSTLLAAYFSISSLLAVPRLRTLCLIPGAAGAAVTFGLILGLNLLNLWLESLSKHEHLLSPQKYAGLGSEPFSGLWKRIGYAWLLMTVRVGYAKILTVDDLPDLGLQVRSHVLLSKLEKAWAIGQQYFLWASSTSRDQRVRMSLTKGNRRQST